MQTPTTQRKPKARTLTADSKLPYPEFRAENRGADFWLVQWMRTTAQYEFIFNKFHNVIFGRCKASLLEADSCWECVHRLRDDAHEKAKNLRYTGGILFAWAGTTHPAVRS